MSKKLVLGKVIFTYEDFTPEQIAALQQPATEAAVSVSKLEQTVTNNETLRATTERGRVNAELLRVRAESERNNAEVSRDSNEADRINAELDRIRAEDLRKLVEINREAAEGLRQTNINVALNAANAVANGKSSIYLIQPTSYKLGDMWVLDSDQTVNGVAYKSGEILTATQDSTTYNYTHWVRKVRYTDDTVAEKKSTTFFAKPSVYQMGDTWYLTKDDMVNGIFYRKGTMLHAAYATGMESDWRQVIYEPDATSGVNILRNYDLRFSDFLFWGSVGTTIDVNVEDLPTEFYKTGFNILADEYGFNYPILDENGGEIVM